MMLRCRPLVLLALILPGCLPFRAKTATSEQIKVARMGLEAWFGDEKWKPKGDGLTIIGPLVRAPGPNIETTSVKVVIEEVFAGSTYDDTCLAEVEVWGKVR